MTQPDSTPLLTIAIPTWNRAALLAKSLTQLESELAKVPLGLVEVLVSDNASPDDTPSVVRAAIDRGLPVRSIRNATNVGWAKNFIQCYELARSPYVLLMGDDDLLVDGALALLLGRLRAGDYGVVCLRPYGFDIDFRGEHPGGRGREHLFTDANQFLVAISRYFTLTSACVINKALLTRADPRAFLSTDIATFHLVLRAALAAERNLFIDKYMVASKRQNSFSYVYTEVFVHQFWRIVDAHVPWGLKPATVAALERRRLVSYYPFYAFDLRLHRRGDPAKARRDFEERFGGRWLFSIWLAPTLTLPRPLALAWGGATTLIGRIADGQLHRVVTFALRRIARSLGWSRRALSDGVTVKEP